MSLRIGSWEWERSSGFPGYRCLVCATWVHERDAKACACQSPEDQFKTREHHRIATKLNHFDFRVLKLEALEALERTINPLA